MCHTTAIKEILLTNNKEFPFLFPLYTPLHDVMLTCAVKIFSQCTGKL